jgi:hypothetical protein
MSGTITRIGAAGAGALLALGIFAAAPAGASGDHDSKAEHLRKAAHVTCLSDEGKTQGRSQSDPDGMSNGGADKPGCGGTFDDPDGNNGCGNDADREDDNNGHCGVKPAQARGEADDAKDADDGEKSTTTTATTVKTTEPETVSPKVEDDSDQPAADDDTVTDSGTEAPDSSSPLKQAGAGFGGMTILIVLARWFLRIG